MKLVGLVCLLAVVAPLASSRVERDTAAQGGSRQVRQAKAEEMVQSILQWLQGIYKQNNRKTRQETLVRGYLPPGNIPDKPRPFQQVTTPQPTYQPSSPTYQPSGPTYQPSGPTYQPSGPTYQPSGPTYQPSGPTYQPSNPEIGGTGEIGVITGIEGGSTGYPASGSTPIPPFESPSPPRPTSPPLVRPPSPQPTYPSSQPSYPSESTFPSPESTYPSSESPYPSSQPTYPRPKPSYPQPESSERPTYSPGPSIPDYSPNEVKPFPTSSPGGDLDGDDANHPPHIHAIDVICAKDMMTINIEFNRVYDGIIYSKGFFGKDECTYVKANSGQTKYSFTVSLNSCGTEFINGFDTEGQSYLENVLVLQNEAGIQEVWDTIRSVRCLWEGNLSKALSVAFSVGMLNQEVVTFSGDTAMASLDIQMGKGPFASPANGLVKIGETMTLVVSVKGDPGFDIQVKDCRARDADSQNVVMLTDDDGCVLKPKLFGAFQKTRQTQNTGASILAYAFFSAFKFPDVMDLIIECNVELCKTDCEMCPDPNQKVDPGRRRRDLYYVGNQTMEEPMTIGKSLRVYLPEDIALADATKTVINFQQSQAEGVCMSVPGFIISSTILMSILAATCIFSAYAWLRLKRNAKF